MPGLRRKLSLRQVHLAASIRTSSLGKRDYSLPSRAKMMTTMRMRPTIPEGPYRQPLLWPHVGKTPSKIRMRIMIRTVPRDMAVPSHLNIYLFLPI
jgi:hypothetical protein